jgi:hypothetical protein
LHIQSCEHASLAIVPLTNSQRLNWISALESWNPQQHSSRSR